MIVVVQNENIAELFVLHSTKISFYIL